MVDITSSSSPTGKFPPEYIGVAGGVGRDVGLCSGAIIWGFRIECRAAASWNLRRPVKSHTKLVPFSKAFPKPDPSPNAEAGLGIDGRGNNEEDDVEHVDGDDGDEADDDLREDEIEAAEEERYDDEAAEEET